MDRDCIVERVFATLDAELKARPRGTKSITEKAVGVREGYLRKMRSKGRISLNQIAAFLDVLDIDPGIFFQRAFPATAVEPSQAGPLIRFRKEAAALAGRFPERPAIRHVATLDALDAAGNLAEAFRASSTTVEPLDALRYADAAMACERVEAAIVETDDPVLAARLLGTWASALRILERFDEAMVVHGRALQLASALQCRPLSAELAERAAVIAGDHGDYAFGIELADHALGLFIELGHEDGIGRALVDRGVMLGQMGQQDAAIASYTASLKMLAADNAPFRCAAHQGLGIVQLRVGALPEADRSLRRALRHAPPRDTYFCGRVAWLRARIAFARGQLAEAKQYFDEALASMSKRSPIDTVLVSAERVRLLLKMGSLQEARSFARDMTKLLLPIDDRPIARAALTDLIRAGLQGDALNIALVDRTIRTLKEDAANRGAGLAGK